MKYKIKRTITYESDDLKKILLQLSKSLPDKTHDLLTRISIESEYLIGPEIDREQINIAIMNESYQSGD